MAGDYTNASEMIRDLAVKDELKFCYMRFVNV